MWGPRADSASHSPPSSRPRPEHHGHHKHHGTRAPPGSATWSQLLRTWGPGSWKGREAVSPSKRPPRPSPLPPPWTPSSAKPPGPRLGRRGSPAPRAGAGGPRGTSQEPHDFKTPDLTSTDHVGHPLALGPDLSQASKAHTRMQLPQERKAALLRGQGEVHGPGDTPRSKLARSGRVGTCPHWPPLCPQGLCKREYRTDLLSFFSVKRTHMQATKNAAGGPEGSS